MKKKLYSLCAILFLVLSGYAQQNYLPGFVVKLKGDTLRGLINYQNSEKNPLNIYFRIDMDHAPDIMSPQEVQSFMVANENYISATVSINEGYYRTEDLGVSPEVQLGTATVFLQSLVRGGKSLYYLKDSEGREQFYVELDNRYELLIYHKYLKNLSGSGDIAGAKSLAEDKRYIGQLSYYLKDCPDIQSGLRNLEYSKQGMVKLFKQYYKCTDANVEYEKKSDETRAEFGFFAGLSLTALKFEGPESFNEVTQADFPVSYNMALGVSFNKKLARNLGRFSVHNEIIFSSYKTSTVYTEYSSENRYVNNNLSIGGTYIKLNNMFQYSFPVKAVSIMLRMGISNGWNLHEINENIVESVFYSTKTTVTEPALEGTKKYAFGVLGGVGCSYKRISLEIRYEQSGGMSDMPSFKSRVGTIFILAGYRF
jgi:hypothetical protein